LIFKIIFLIWNIKELPINPKIFPEWVYITNSLTLGIVIDPISRLTIASLIDF